MLVPLSAISVALLAAAPDALASAVPDWRQHPLVDVSHPPEPLEQPPELQRVNITLYAMSRCPDARMCESVFDEVIKHDGIKDKIDLWVDFLGQPDKKATYGVSCMHGDLECAGNAHQLCLQVHLDLDQFYPTLSCMNYGNFPGSIGSVALTRKCAETSGVDWWKSGVGRCIQGQRAEREGRAAQRQVEQDRQGSEVYPPQFDDEEDDAPPEHLGSQARRYLRRSVYRTKEADVTKSCTIDIVSTINHAGKRRCIVDGGVWKGCDDGHTPSDFVSVIDKEWKSLNGMQ